MLFPDLLSGDARHTVVLLHSSGASARQWQPLATTLGARFDVQAPDLHGHGSTPAWTGAAPMTLADEVARLQALLDHVHGPVHLVGHSYGGAVATALALQRPHAFRSLTVYEPVLFSVLLHYNARASELRAAMRVAERMRTHLAYSRFDLAGDCFVDFWSAPGTWSALGAMRQHAVAIRMPTVLSHFDALFSLGLRMQDLRELHVPVQLLHGTATRPVTRRVVELLAHALPQVRTLQIEGLGHMGPVTDPARVNPHSAAFVEAHGGTQAAPSANAARWRQVA
jgi:pimeloyl-ACP methyl ester carboxylesterase